jgi:hypothetical protein
VEELSFSSAAVEFLFTAPTVSCRNQALPRIGIGSQTIARCSDSHSKEVFAFVASII